MTETPEQMAQRLIADPDLPWIGEPTDDDPAPDEQRLAEEPEHVELEPAQRDEGTVQA